MDSKAKKTKVINDRVSKALMLGNFSMRSGGMYRVKEDFETVASGYTQK